MKKLLRTVVDGVTIVETCDAGLLQALLCSGDLPQSAHIEEVAQRPAAADVRAEASLRMQALVGARDEAHLQIVIANASREAIRLLRIKADRDWSTEETARAAALEWADTMIEAIWAASNAMELAPPDDFAADSHWA